MPPKKKGSKKSSKGKKGKKGEPEITFKEAVLAYRIGLVEKQLEEWKYEEKNLEEQLERLTERNTRLQEEQDQYMKILLKQSRDFERKNITSDKIGKGQVLDALQDKWLAAREEDRRLEEMQADILKLEKKISKTRKEILKWLEYKNVGSIQRADQIKLLEKEMSDMAQTFQEMSDHMSKNLDSTKEKIILNMEKALNEQKHSASEKAMVTLDKNNRQEVLDNDWMKDELKRHAAECKLLEEQVGEIEKENLALMEELFECNIEDLRLTKNLFLTQFEDNDDLEKNGLLEVDLNLVSLLGGRKTFVTDLRDEGEQDDHQTSILEEQGEDHTAMLEDNDHTKHLADLYNFDDDEISEYLQLGPLELKLLNLTGEPKEIHILGGVTEEEIAARHYNPDDWPVTQPMLKSAIST